MDIPLDVRQTEGFRLSWAEASYELRGEASEFDEKLLATITKLWEEHPGLGVPSKSAEHSIPVAGSYELVYEWATDRTLKGDAIANHLDLLLVRHKK